MCLCSRQYEAVVKQDVPLSLGEEIICPFITRRIAFPTVVTKWILSAFLVAVENEVDVMYSCTFVFAMFFAS